MSMRAQEGVVEVASPISAILELETLMQTIQTVSNTCRKTSKHKHCMRSDLLMVRSRSCDVAKSVLTRPDARNLKGSFGKESIQRLAILFSEKQLVDIVCNESDSDLLVKKDY